MGQLLYFIPEPVGLLALGALQDRGLGYAFERGPAHCRTFKGPDGGGGVVIAQDGGAFGFHGDRQAWRKLPDSDVWVGYYNDDRPGPFDLSRKEQLTGHSVRLSDGNDWLCPVARAWNDGEPGCVLPRSIDRVNGEWRAGDVVHRYAALWAIAQRFFDEIAGQDGSVTIPENEALDGVTTILAANYRLGPEEVGLLGLFDTNSARDVIFACIDWPTIAEWSKKKQAEGTPVGSST